MEKFPTKLISDERKIQRTNMLQRRTILQQVLLLIVIVIIDLLVNWFFHVLNARHLLPFNFRLAVEILFIGLFIIYAGHIRDRNKRIVRYIEEIETLPVQGSQRGTFLMKILLRRLTFEKYRGELYIKNIKSVRNESFQDIKLSISLYNMKAEKIEILNSIFGNRDHFEMHNVGITGSQLSNTVFTGGEFYTVYFHDSLFDRCRFYNDSFTSLQFDHVKMWNVHFVKCLFRNPVRLNLGKQGVESMDLMVTSGFICSRLQECVFEDVRFEGIDFTGATLINCQFSNVTGLKASDFHHVKTLYRSVLPEDINQSLRQSHPQLFEKPEH